jgi:hypothetical protein
VLIVVATYYALFAVIGGGSALLAECGFITLFVITAALGFRGNMWLVAAGLIGHGVFDFSHHHMIQNPGVPAWWPMFCAMYDITAGFYLAWLILLRGQKQKRP